MIFSIVIYVGGYLLTLSSLHLMTKYNKYLNNSKNKWQLLVNFTKLISKFIKDKNKPNEVKHFSYQNHFFHFICTKKFNKINDSTIELLNTSRGEHQIYLYEYVDLDSPNDSLYIGVTDDNWQIYKHSGKNNKNPNNIIDIFSKMNY